MTCRTLQGKYAEKLETENKRLREIVENLTTMTVYGDRKQIKNTAQYKLELAEQKIDKAIEEIKCEIERYDGSNEDFISTSWVEMKTDDYIAKLKNILEILEGKDDRE